MATSSKSVTIDLNLPTAWEDLSQKQLKYLFSLLAMSLSSAEVKAYCLCRWGGVKVLHKYAHSYMCRVGEQDALLHPQQVAAATKALDWIDQPPTFPVRLEKIGRHKAVPADFEGVPFEVFIICDNLYQGYLSTKKDELLASMAAQLYKTKRIKPREAEKINVFYWFSALKLYLTKRFKHFFQPATSGGNGNMFEVGRSQLEMLQNAMNAQIRALTKGDITKEKEVLALDTWRALTELDCQAREYEELNSKYPMNK